MGLNRVFGIAGKERLAKGHDADLTRVDLKARREIGNEDQAGKVGWTPFHGMMAMGWPMATLVRGAPGMREGEVSGEGMGAPVRFQGALAPG